MYYYNFYVYSLYVHKWSNKKNILSQFRTYSRALIKSYLIPPPNTQIVTECILIFPRGTSKGAMKDQRTQNGQISPIFFLPHSSETPGWCNRTWRRIPKGSEHTTTGDPAAKLCGMPLNIDVTNVEKDKKKIFLQVSKKVRHESSKCGTKFNKRVHCTVYSVHTQKMSVRGGEVWFDKGSTVGSKLPKNRLFCV